MRPAIEFDSVSFSYPDATGRALEDVSFRIEPGTFALVTGPTGAGKSTLLRACNGLVPHFTGGRFSGRVRLAGRDTIAAAPRDLADVAGYVPQDPSASFVVDRVEDEIAYAMENLGVEPTEMRRRVEEMLDLLNLGPLRDRSVRLLSGGERQRVAIAAALAPGGSVLLLDEPTSQLDPQGAEDVLAALQRMVHDLGLTVVVAEHRLERVAGFADIAIGCLPLGRVIVGPTGEVLERLDSGPPVTRLGRLLGWRPAPLTVREARRHAASMGPPQSLPDLPTPARAPVARAEGLTAGYGEEPVLRAIDLTIGVGEMVALVGRNGAGKTTLLRCLAGLHGPERGRVTYRGAAPVPGRDVALCPQFPEDVLFAQTVAEEVGATLARRRPGRGRGDVGADGAARWLEALGLTELAGHHPRDVSAGERVLVAIAAMAATGGGLLLLDEPTRGLDTETKARLAAFLRSQAAEGRAIVVATHDVELVAEVAERVVMLAGGEVVADGLPRAVLAGSAVFSPQVARVFDGHWLTLGEAALALGRS